MRPHSKDADGLLPGENFIHQPVVNIDATRVRALEVAYKLFEWRRVLKWIGLQKLEERLGLGLQTRGSQLSRILDRLF